MSTNEDMHNYKTPRTVHCFRQGEVELPGEHGRVRGAGGGRHGGGRGGVLPDAAREHASHALARGRSVVRTAFHVSKHYNNSFLGDTRLEVLQVSISVNIN